jgi:hypothetical protein
MSVNRLAAEQGDQDSDGNWHAQQMERIQVLYKIKHY